MQKRYRGVLAAEVKTVSTAAEVRALVASNPSAIGYLDSADVDATVKVVLEE